MENHVQVYKLCFERGNELNTLIDHDSVNSNTCLVFIINTQFKYSG